MTGNLNLSRDARLELQFRWVGFFLQRHFGRYLDRPMSAMHNTLLREVHDLAHGHGRMALEGARGHGKSVIANLVAGCYVACLALHMYILVIGTRLGAPEHMANIITELEENETLLADFGESILPAISKQQRKKAWNNEYVILNNGVKIGSLTKGKSARGLRHGPHRPSFIIVDDVQTDQDVETFESREKDKRWFQQQILGCQPPGMKGSIVFIDTVKDDDCLVRWLKENQAWNHYSYPGRDPVTGAPLWLSEQELTDIEIELGPTAFSKEILLNPQDPSVQVFRWEEFGKFDFGDVDMGFDGPRMVGSDELQRLVLSHDPIPRLTDESERTKSDLKRGDYGSSVLGARGTNLKSFGLNKRPNRYVLEEFTARADLDRHLEWIADTAVRWDMGPSDLVVVESNNFAKLVGRDLRALLKARGLAVPVKCEPATTKKTTRMFSQEGEIVRHEVLFASNLSPAYQSQWNGLRRDNSHAHDDGPDATEKTNRHLRLVDTPSGRPSPGRGVSGAWIGPPGRSASWQAA